MGIQRWLSWTLPVLVTGTVAVGVIGADEVSPDIQPLQADTSEVVAMPEHIAAPDQPVVPEQGAKVEQTAVPEESAVAQEAAAPEVTVEPEAVVHAAEGKTVPLVLVPAMPPRSQQTLVDEQRDLLRKRRNAMFDAYSGRGAYMPPEIAAYNDAVEHQRDALRRSYRQQRDQSMQRHDRWMDAICPWSKPQRNRSRQRSYQMQMEQLERQAARDAWLYGRPYVTTGPTPW